MRRSNFFLTVCLFLVAFGVAGLSSCGGGGDQSRAGDQVTIMPPGGGMPFDDSDIPADHSDESDTPAAASTIAVGGTANGYLDSPGDVDYFRMSLKEASIVDLSLHAPPGTLFTVLDEAGRVLATATVPEGAGSGSIGTRSAVTALPAVTVALSFVAPAVDVLIKVTAGQALRRAALYTIATAAVAVNARNLYIVLKDNVMIDVDANGEIRQNLREYIECRLRENNRKIEGCELEFEITGSLTVTGRLGPVPVSASIEGNTLAVAAPCSAEGGGGQLGIEVSAKVGDEVVARRSATIPIRVRESEDCESCLVQVVFSDHGYFTPSRFFTSDFDNFLYTGFCRNGRADGQGTVTASNAIGQNLSYTGEWRDGQPRGRGKWRISDTNFGEMHYDGDWRDGQPNGQGTGNIEFNNGNTWRYVGPWVGGNPHGSRGTWTALTNGDRFHYVGEFRNGLQHGRGVETNTYANGDRERLVGEFRNDNLWNGTATWNGVSCRVVNGEGC